MRIVLIWGALRKGLLERLENMPIRFAFTRFKVMGWMTMLRSAGLQEQWRDLARSLESMRQMLHDPDLLRSDSRLLLEGANAGLLEEIERFSTPPTSQGGGGKPKLRPLDFMREVEIRLAAFSQDLLSVILIPYWNDKRIGLVESEGVVGTSDKARESQVSTACPPVPDHILVAEEFLAIRYLSLIRAVLVNLRYLMIFVSASFVLAAWAWNSYPFQPRQLGDWAFTGLLAVLGTSVVWVFAQMHRNPILSRITDTNANELGLDFYLRVISFGALPLFTWLAYQFPDIGSFVSKFLQPVTPVIK